MAGSESELLAFKDAIRKKYEIHCQCFDNRDAAPLFTEFFTKDALWSGQDYPEQRGESQMRPFFDEVTANYTVACKSMVTYVNGDSGWDYVQYPVQPRNSDEESWIFRVMFYWVRVDGDWKVNAVMSYIVSDK